MKLPIFALQHKNKFRKRNMFIQLSTNTDRAIWSNLLMLQQFFHCKFNWKNGINTNSKIKINKTATCVLLIAASKFH